MAEPKAIKAVPTEAQNLPATLVQQSWSVAERATLATYATARDLRAELSQRIITTIDWIEGWQHSIFKLMREASTRGDKLALEALDASEQVTLVILGTGRTTALGATEIAARTASSWTGEKEAASKAA